MPFVRLKTGQKERHPKHQPTLQMPRLRQTVWRRQAAQPPIPMASLYHRQADCRTVGSHIRLQQQNHLPASQKSRSQNKVCRPFPRQRHHGHHLLWPHIWCDGSVRQHQQTGVIRYRSQTRNQRPLRPSNKQPESQRY